MVMCMAHIIYEQSIYINSIYYPYIIRLLYKNQRLSWVDLVKLGYTNAHIALHVISIFTCGGWFLCQFFHYSIWRKAIFNAVYEWKFFYSIHHKQLMYTICKQQYSLVGWRPYCICLIAYPIIEILSSW